MIAHKRCVPESVSAQLGAEQAPPSSWHRCLLPRIINNRVISASFLLVSHILPPQKAERIAGVATRKTTGIYWECGKRTRVSFWTRRRETGGQRHRRRAPGGTARLRGCPRPLSLPNPRGRTRRTPRGKPGRPHPAAGTRTPRAATGRRSGRPSRRVAPLPSLTPKGGQLVPAEGGVAPRQAAAAQKQAARQEQHAQHRRGLARHDTARLGSARRDAQPLLSAPGDRLRRALPRGGQSSDPTPRKEGEARGGGARRGRRAVPPRVAGAGSGGGTAGSPGSRSSRAARVPLIGCQRVRSPRSGSLVLERAMWHQGRKPVRAQFTFISMPLCCSTTPWMQT